jgi:Xaa-Pro aminopeptidase
MVPLRYGKGNVDWQQRIDFDQLRRKRLEKANTYLAKYGIGAAILFNHDRKRYLTSVMNHPYAKHVPRDFILFIRDAGFPYVGVMSGLDEGRVLEDCPWLEGKLLNETQLLQPRMWRFKTEENATRLWSTTADQIKGLLKKHDVADMPLSIDYCNPYFMHALEAAGLKVVDGNAWIDECGMVKFDEEIILMKMAATCQETGYGALYRDFRVGMRENDAQAIMTKAIYEAGAEYMEGWVTNSGERGVPRSFNWSDRVVRPREFLNMEACHATYCGYKVCYDRTFLVGAKPSELQKEIYQVAVEMQNRISTLLKPGLTTHELARKKPKPGENLKTPDQIRKWRATWSNHLGGIGIAWDSAPNYSSTDETDVVLGRNMTIAYHAMFWTEGDLGGVTIENTYRITEDGCECLTRWPYEEIMVIGI